MGAIFSIMWSSFSAMAKIFLVCIVGAGCARLPKKDPLLSMDALRDASRLQNLVLLPFLIMFSLGSSLSLELFQRIGILSIFCFLNCVISYTIAGTIGKLMHEKNRDDLFTAVYVSIGSPNIISLPIMVMQTLCDSAKFNVDYDDDSRVCFAEATSMLFVYSVGWHLLFWSYGFPILQGIGKQRSSNDTAHLSTVDYLRQVFDKKKLQKLGHTFYKILITPPMIGIFLGITIGLIEPLQTLLFEPDQPLRFVGSAMETLGDPVITMSCLTMAASLAHGDFTVFNQAWKRHVEGFLFKELGEVTEVTEATDGDQKRQMDNVSVGRGSEMTAANLNRGNNNDRNKSGFNSRIEEGTGANNSIINYQKQHEHYNRIAEESDAAFTPHHLTTLHEVDLESATDGRVEVTLNPMRVCTTSAHSAPGVAVSISDNNSNSNSSTSGYNQHGTRKRSASMRSGDSNGPRVRSGSTELCGLTLIGSLEAFVEDSMEEESESATDGTATGGVVSATGLTGQQQQQGEDAVDEVDASKIPLPEWRSIATLIVCRMILPPLVTLVLIQLSLSMGILHTSEKMMLVIILIESASPSALTIIVCLNQLGLKTAAVSMSYMFLFQFFTSILTITIWTTIAISLYY